MKFKLLLKDYLTKAHWPLSKKGGATHPVKRKISPNFCLLKRLINQVKMDLTPTKVLEATAAKTHCSTTEVFKYKKLSRSSPKQKKAAL